MKRTLTLSLFCAGTLFALSGAETPSAESVKMIQGSGVRMANETFQIDPSKTYRLSGKFKAAKPEKGWFNFGLAPVDASWQAILPDQVNPVMGSDTVLAKDAKAGDTVLTLKDSKNWKNGNYLSVKFNTKTDLSDLPNRDGAEFGKIEGNTVTLKKALTKAYPAGTNVRLHTSGDTYMYSGAAYKNVPSDRWVEFAGEISGESKAGLNPRQFWRGTRMVRVMMLTNQKDVMFKDISLDEIEAK